jgi:L-fuconolactonase
MTPRIDAHQHFWHIARGDYSWLTPALGAIYRDFNPEDLAPHLAAHGIAATILVQAAPTHAETAFLLDLADKTAFVAGVVGWTEFATRRRCHDRKTGRRSAARRSAADGAGHG